MNTVTNPSPGIRPTCDHSRPATRQRDTAAYTRTLSSATRSTGDTLAVHMSTNRRSFTEQWKVIAGLRWDQLRRRQLYLELRCRRTITAPLQPPRNTDDMLCTRAGVLAVQPTGTSRTTYRLATRSILRPSPLPAVGQQREPGSRGEPITSSVPSGLVRRRVVADRCSVPHREDQRRIPDPIDSTCSGAGRQSAGRGHRIRAVGRSHRIGRSWRATASWTARSSSPIPSVPAITPGIEQGKRFQNTPGHQCHALDAAGTGWRLRSGAPGWFTHRPPPTTSSTAFIDSL